MKKVYIFNILIISFLMLKITACNRITPLNLLDDDHTALTQVPISVSSISSEFAASSIQELAYYSDIVVVGQVISKEGIINTSRDPSNPTKPDSRFFSINQVYKVDIERILKGETIKSLLLVQKQGLLTITTEKMPTLAEIESEINRNKQKTFIPLSLNTNYIFFLKVLDNKSYDLDGYKSTDLYAGVAEPWRFKFTNEDFIVPETLFSDMNLCFPMKTLGDIEAIIELGNQNYTPNANTPCYGPYPPPSTNAPSAKVQTPYP